MHEEGRAPSISVIIPVFNTEKYLREAIDSLLSQATPFHEIIVVNDASTDGSSAILKDYASRGQVRLIEFSENRGQGTARNEAILRASGDYLYFFDSDDWVESELVVRVGEIIRQNPSIDVIAFGGEAFYEGASPMVLPQYGRPYIGLCGTFLEAALALEVLRANYTSPCLYVVRRELLVSANLRFGSYFHEDDVFLLHLAANARTTFVSSVSLFHRRLRAGSTVTGLKSHKHMAGYFEASQVSLQYAKRANCSHHAARAYFRRKAAQYYHQAISLPLSSGSLVPRKGPLGRIRGLPSLSLTWIEFGTLILGPRLTKLVKAGLRRIRIR